jgi:hypothetical protein
MGKHRDDESSGSVTEASERLSAQPAILYYKAQTASVFEHAGPCGHARIWRAHSIIVSARCAPGPMVSRQFCLQKKVESCRAPHADLSSIPAFTQSRVGRAYTREAWRILGS